MSESNERINKAAREIVAEWLAQPPEAQTFTDLAVRAMRAAPRALECEWFDGVDGGERSARRAKGE